MAQLAPGSAPPVGDRTDSFIDWIQLHARELIIGAIVVAVLAVGIFVYRQSQISSERAAEQAFFAAQAAAQTGDPQQAETELARVASAYRGTAGGTQAAMALAQLRFERGAYAEGLAVLQQAAGDASDEFAAGVQGLIGAGLEGMGNFAEAAEAYRRAAAEAEFTAEEHTYLADAARVLRLAGSDAAAVEIWQQLADDPTSTFAPEARVRLGELQAAPAGQG